nr:L-seryl-tRNA(Sec) selenium transferase [Thalassobacillus pellis]
MRKLPPVHELQRESSLLSILDKHAVTKKLWTSWIQRAVDEVRKEIQSLSYNGPHELKMEIISRVQGIAETWASPRLQRVINGTGTVIHTNLGRARLSDQAVKQVSTAARHFTNLEFDLEKSTRGSRHTIIEDLIREVTGAEAAIVVNNNAAAVYFVLRTFTKNRKVIVSRGELVEIGGSFRVSSIMEESDAILTEIGTTNKTHYTDYLQAIDDETRMIMKVHTSNFFIKGFTESQSSKVLAPLAKENDLIYYEDLGSGSLYDYRASGIGTEPVVKEVVHDGADLVSFSGDKLLGGPQAGIIAGKKQWIDILKKHQLARVLRVDKMTLAALESTLKDYLKGEEALQTNPVWRDIKKTQEEIKTKVDKFLNSADSCHGIHFEGRPCISKVGGGTMPDVELASYGVAVYSENMTAGELERSLRRQRPAIIGRIMDETFYLDFRTIGDSEIEETISAFQQISDYMS